MCVYICVYACVSAKVITVVGEQGGRNVRRTPFIFDRDCVASGVDCLGWYTRLDNIDSFFILFSVVFLCSVLYFC